MKYIEYIDKTQTWTVTATGKWKVICVGGGGSGHGSNSTDPTAAGGTTSFGTYLSAAGGASHTNHGAQYSCYIGYDGVNNLYGENGAYHSAQIGYGAGGLNYYPGVCGEVKTTIIDLTANTQIPCSIGAGGTSKNSANNAVTSTGSAGVIILQYLGT